MRNVLFLVIVVILSNYVAAQMLTQELGEGVNISSVLENLSEAETAKVSEKIEVNLTQKNRECQLRYECMPHEDYFYYSCYFDENISDCRCFVGLFSMCNLEASNLSIIAKPTPKEIFVVKYVKEKLKSIEPLLILAKGVLYNWRTGVVGILIVLVILIVFYAYNRDTPSNNLRKASSYHKKAQELYEKGRYEKAEKYYKLAEEYRKRVKEF